MSALTHNCWVAPVPRRKRERRVYTDGDWPYVWWYRRLLPERKGEPCRLLVAGSLRSALVEFQDGSWVRTDIRAVRKRAAS